MLAFHRSVMPAEVLENINFTSMGRYADVTFGEGGHSDLLLERGAGVVVGVDRDDDAIKKYLAQGKYRQDTKLSFVSENFSKFAEQASPNSFDGIIADLGVSTAQLKNQERGFSFAQAGPLDMRMDRRQSVTLEKLLQNTNVMALADKLEQAVDLKHPE